MYRILVQYYMCKYNIAYSLYVNDSYLTILVDHHNLIEIPNNSMYYTLLKYDKGVLMES